VGVGFGGKEKTISLKQGNSQACLEPSTGRSLTRQVGAFAHAREPELRGGGPVGVASFITGNLVGTRGDFSDSSDLLKS